MVIGKIGWSGGHCDGGWDRVAKYGIKWLECHFLRPIMNRTRKHFASYFDKCAAGVVTNYV